MGTGQQHSFTLQPTDRLTDRPTNRPVSYAGYREMGGNDSPFLFAFRNYGCSEVLWFCIEVTLNRRTPRAEWCRGIKSVADPPASSISSTVCSPQPQTQKKQIYVRFLTFVTNIPHTISLLKKKENKQHRTNTNRILFRTFTVSNVELPTTGLHIYVAFASGVRFMPPGAAGLAFLLRFAPS